MRVRRPERLPVRYRIGQGDSVTVNLHGRLLRRLGFRSQVTLSLVEVRRAAKGARRDRDAAIIVVQSD